MKMYENWTEIEEEKGFILSCWQQKTINLINPGYFLHFQVGTYL